MVNGIWLVQPPLREAFLFVSINKKKEVAIVPANRAIAVMSGKANVLIC